MPELPEVETVRKGLARLLPGLVVASVESNWQKSFPNAPDNVEQFLVNAKITSVRRRAKVIIIELDNNYALIVHLKMTGQLVFSSQTERFGAGHPGESLVGKLPDKSTRVILTFTNGSRLFFNDQRKFGWMKLVPQSETTDLAYFSKFGPEPLEKDFTWQIMRDRLMRRKNSTIKAALLDQSVIAGVGNIYADESLWAAKIYPGLTVSSLSEEQFRQLYQELLSVLKLSIEKGGSTDKNYVDAEGRKGSYLSFARVFRREGQACPRCGETIEKIRVAGRGTHYCPICQKPINSSKRKSKVKANGK
jgi:formamidopyrimidine-DNA glycosylase